LCILEVIEAVEKCDSPESRMGLSGGKMIIESAKERKLGSTSFIPSARAASYSEDVIGFVSCGRREHGSFARQSAHLPVKRTNYVLFVEFWIWSLDTSVVEVAVNDARTSPRFSGLASLLGPSDTNVAVSST
jgi:hypothetical protein